MSLRGCSTALCAAVIVLLPVGCGGTGSPWEVVPVSGIVTWRGEPVHGLIVEFEPDSGRPSQGRTDDQGRFSLSYTIHKAGAQVGPHRVTFSWADQFEGDRPTPAVKEIMSRHGRSGEPIAIDITGATRDLLIELPR
jgi:hypothetical protein